MEWLTTTRAGLACWVAAAVVLAATGNLLIVLAGWDRGGGPAVVPAGWRWVDQVVSYVWLVLFAAMGTSAWLAYTSGHATAVRDGRVVLALMAICILYPVYTLGMRPVPGLVGNIVVVALTVAAVAVVRQLSPAAAWLLIRLGVWVSLASVYLAKLLAPNS